MGYEVLLRRMKLYREGKTDREIAEAEKTNVCAIVRWRRRLGIPPNPGKRELERKQKIETLRAMVESEIYPPNVICVKLGISKSTLRRWMRSNNVEYPTLRLIRETVAWWKQHKAKKGASNVP